MNINDVRNCAGVHHPGIPLDILGLRVLKDICDNLMVRTKLVKGKDKEKIRERMLSLIDNTYDNDMTIHNKIITLVQPYKTQIDRDHEIELQFPYRFIHFSLTYTINYFQICEEDAVLINLIFSAVIEIILDETSTCNAKDILQTIRSHPGLKKSFVLPHNCVFLNKKEEDEDMMNILCHIFIKRNEFFQLKDVISPEYINGVFLSPYEGFSIYLTENEEGEKNYTSLTKLYVENEPLLVRYLEWLFNPTIFIKDCTTFHNNPFFLNDLSLPFSSTFNFVSASSNSVSAYSDSVSASSDSVSASSDSVSASSDSVSASSTLNSSPDSLAQPSYKSKPITLAVREKINNVLTNNCDHVELLSIAEYSQFISFFTNPPYFINITKDHENERDLQMKKIKSLIHESVIFAQHRLPQRLLENRDFLLSFMNDGNIITEIRTPSLFLSHHEFFILKQKHEYRDRDKMVIDIEDERNVEDLISYLTTGIIDMNNMDTKRFTTLKKIAEQFLLHNLSILCDEILRLMSLA
jgi:hypothetical protein